MLKILQTLNDGWIVRDSAYRGDFNEEDHEERVPRDFPGMRVPTKSSRDLVDGFNSLFNGDEPSGIMGRYDCWGEIGVILDHMDVMLTSTLVPSCSVDADVVTVGRFAVSTTPKVQRKLQRFALNLLTGRIGMEEDEKHRFTFFWIDGVRDKGRETYRLDEHQGSVPREHFEAMALALREMGLVRCFDPSLIKITQADGSVSWGRINTSLRIEPAEEPDEMIIPGTELVAPKDASERIEALQRIWVGVGDDETLAFKARAAMAWAISTLPPMGKIFTWFDTGGTGKTSFIDGFDSCFPSKAASVNWDSINKGDFPAGAEFSKMIGKSVSFSDETPQLGKKESALATMKGLSTGQTVTARHGNGKFSTVYLRIWQVIFSNVGSIFPKGYAFERRLVHMPKVSEPEARHIPKEMHGDETLGDWLFSPSEVGSTFMALAIAGQGVWEEDFQCKWPKALEKWDGESDDTQLDQFVMPPKDSEIYLEAESVADTLKSKSKVFIEGVRKLARVWNAGDGFFYGDHDADSSATGRIPRSFMLLDEKTEGFNASLTACHDPATVSGFIPADKDGTVDNFAAMLRELGVKSKTITRRGEFYPGGPASLKAPHAEDSDKWKAVRIVLGVQAYGPAVYEAPEVEHEENVDSTPQGTATPVQPVGPNTIPPVESQSTPIPPVPSPIKLGSREAQRAIHATYGVEGDLIAVDPETKHPKGTWKKAGKEKYLTKTWPDGEQACAFIPTGHTVILDLDCHNDGESGWDVLNKEVGIYGSDSFPKTLGELTPSGGIHLLYYVDDLKFVARLKNESHPKNERHPNGIEVDVKVNGEGQAVCAGSRNSKGCYKICSLPEGNRLAVMSEAMKSWLAHNGYVREDPLVTERKRKEEEARRARRRAEREARRLQGDEPSKPAFLSEMESEVDEAIDNLATASIGGRNSALNATAYGLFNKSKTWYGEYPDEDWLDDESLKERLVAAGIESGLETSEVIATVNSAWSGVFGGTTTVAAPVVAPVIEPEEDTEVQSLVNEDLKRSSSGRGESLFQAVGYEVNWRGDFHKTSQEELELIHEDDGWGEPVDKINTTQEELEAIHEDDTPNMDGLFGPDGIDGWGNEDYVANYEIAPLEEETNPHHGVKDPDTNGSRFEDLFDEDETDGWVNAVDNVYDSTYPIVPLEEEEIDFDELLGF